jgi:hypothetical protein
LQRIGYQVGTQLIDGSRFEKKNWGSNLITLVASIPLSIVEKSDRKQSNMNEGSKPSHLPFGGAGTEPIF